MVINEIFWSKKDGFNRECKFVVKYLFIAMAWSAVNFMNWMGGLCNMNAAGPSRTLSKKPYVNQIKTKQKN